MRLQITFSKTEAMRFTGHLDLHRTWERTVRRARLPLAYSQGFNPRPKINLAAALPLGYTSQCEIVEIWLEHALPLDQVETNLVPALPPGIEIVSVEVVEPKGAKLPNLVQAAEYTAILLDPVPDLEVRANQLTESESLPRQRRGKDYDLRPLIETLRLETPTPAGHQQVLMRLAARTGATGRPDEVLDAMGIPPQRARITRTVLHLKSS
jgi:radical SAM-linked protein